MRKVWLVAFACWIAASTLAVWLYPVTIPDTTMRYAPMADAFARGDFYHAFHPRFGFAFQILAGTVAWATGLSGDCSTQVVSFLFVALAAVVAYAVAKRLGGSDESAWWTFALVLLAPDFFRFALDGLRDTGKCLVFALFAYGILVRSGRAFGLAVFLYIAMFSYGFVVSTVLAFVWVAYWLRNNEPKKTVWPFVGWVGGTSVMTAVVHSYTGCWVPIPQLVKYAEGLL